MVTVYGADWCEDTRRSRRHLRRLGLKHIYQNVDLDAAALARAIDLNGGSRRTPVIDIDGEVFVEPPNETLTNALIRHAEITDEDARERQRIQNVGDVERGLRVGLGALALVGSARARGVAKGPLMLVGAVALLTGIAGWCPGYNAAGVSSLSGPGDRPDEAERSNWLAAS